MDTVRHLLWSYANSSVYGGGANAPAPWADERSTACGRRWMVQRPAVRGRQLSVKFIFRKPNPFFDTCHT